MGLAATSGLVLDAARSGIAHAATLHDGPGVLRAIAPVEELERDAQWLGRLTPPPATALPAGVSLRTGADGVRVATINLHMAVPGGVKLAPANESIAGLRDIARFINSINPDVVLVQEVRNRPRVAGMAGITDMVSGLAHLTGSTDVAFTPAVVRDPRIEELQHYGTAIFTRNDFRIDRAANVALPNLPGIEPRSAGIASILAPDGRSPLTVVSTHLAHRRYEDQALRDAQLGALLPMLDSIRADGSFTYTDALTGERQLATGFARDRIVLGGDLNQQQAATDAVLHRAGLIHANDLAAAERPTGSARAAEASRGSLLVSDPGMEDHRIDHLYVAGARVRDVALAEVSGAESKVWPTDHLGFVADLVD